MQMFKRLLLIVAVIVLSSGCAKRPVEELESARSVVAHAYASGAAQHAPGEYQLASSTLQAAELQVKNGEYRKAARTLYSARRYLGEAHNLTIVRKGRMVSENKRIAEELRLEEILR